MPESFHETHNNVIYPIKNVSQKEIEIAVSNAISELTKTPYVCSIKEIKYGIGSTVNISIEMYRELKTP